MSLLQTFPPNFEFKQLIPLEKIKIADSSIILEHSQKCVVDKIEVKMLVKSGLYQSPPQSQLYRIVGIM
jgi:uncharacterized protein YaiL (DUF2058 family)